MTSRRGGSNGAGVPMPRHANSKMQPASDDQPDRSRITIHPQRPRIGRTLLGRRIQRGRNHVQIEMKSARRRVVRRTAKRRRLVHQNQPAIFESPCPPFADLPIAHTDPVNAQILAVSEDRIQGFVRDPIGEIARAVGRRCGDGDRAHPGDAARRDDPPRAADADGDQPRPGRARRLAVSGRASSTRRSTSCSDDDPFSGHVVIRSTDAATPGSNYRLWTTVKVPQGYSIEKHCELLGAARPAPSTSA